MRSLPTWQDSDSDMEDFLNIVSESRKAYTFTETTLQKFHKDHTDGIVRDPVEFVNNILLNYACILFNYVQFQ